MQRATRDTDQEKKMLKFATIGAGSLMLACGITGIVAGIVGAGVATLGAFAVGFVVWND